MASFGSAVRFLWDAGFYTIVLPFILTLVISFYFFKWYFEEKLKKRGKKYDIARYVLTAIASILVLYISLATNAVGVAIGIIAGIAFLVIFFLFIFIILAYFMGWEDIGKRFFGK